MWRAIFIFVVIAILAFVMAWFADRPGAVTMTWLGYEIQTSVMFAAAVVAIFIVLVLTLWSVVRRIIGAPGSISGFFKSRRRQKGYNALSQGMIAVGAGDGQTAHRLSEQAANLLRDEPLTLMLKAQAAQLNGDQASATRVFKAMLQAPETESLGLHGLFVQARRDNDSAAARVYAERAMKEKPELAWATLAVLALQSADNDWKGATRTLEVARLNKLVEKSDAARQKAVLMVAQAMEIEDTETDRALVMALDAHKLAPALVQAAVIAGRILASQSNTKKAARVLEKTWKLAPHPDLAEIYAHARPGDSPRDRLKRVKTLTQKLPSSIEGPVAVARAAIEARDWKEARTVLSPYLEDKLQSRICLLMAEVEGGENGARGKVREWLARAVRAPRDPAWTADGYVSETWMPVSPVSGKLDALQWLVPVESLAYHGAAELLDALETSAEDADESTEGDDGEPFDPADAAVVINPVDDSAEKEESQAADSGTPATVAEDDSAPAEEIVEAVAEEQADSGEDDEASKQAAIVEPEVAPVPADDAAEESEAPAAEEVKAIEGEATPEQEVPDTDSTKTNPKKAGSKDTGRKGAGPKDAGPKDQIASDDENEEVFVIPRAPDDPGPEPKKNGSRNWFD